MGAKKALEIAKNIKAGDQVFVFGQDGAHNLNHVTGDVTVKWRVRNSDNKITSFIQSLGFPNVSIRSLRMPINTVNFKRKIKAWNEKINRVSVNLGLLFKRFTDFFKAQSNGLFWCGFACILMVATWAAKFAVFGKFAGLVSEFNATIQAFFGVAAPL